MFVKIIRYFAYIFSLYLIVGFLLLPLLLKPQIIKFIESQTNTKVTLNSLSFNPLICDLKLNDVIFKSLENKPLLSFKSLEVNLNPTSLIYGALELKELLLESPKLSLVYNKNRTMNIDNILKKHPDTKVKDSQKASLPRIIIDSVKIVDGVINYKDFTKKTPFKFSLEKLGFLLKNLDTKNMHATDADVRLYAKLGDGGFFDIKDNITSLAPFRLRGSVDFEASKLYTEWKYLRDILKLEVADGKVSFSAKYHFSMDDVNATQIKFTKVAVEKLRIKPTDGTQDILNLHALHVRDAQINPFSRKVIVENVKLNGLHAKAKRFENGTIDWVAYLQTKQHQASSKKATKKGAWHAKINHIALENMSLAFDDRAVKPNVKSNIDNLNVYVKNMTLSGKKPLEYKITMQVNKSGLCRANGDLRLESLLLHGYSSCKDLDVAYYRPYIDTIAAKNLKVYDVELKSLLAGFQAQTKLYDINNTLVVQVTDANATLKKMHLLQKSTKKDLLLFKDFNAKALQLNTKTKELNIGSVALNNLICKLSRNSNKKFNVQNIIVLKNSHQKKRESQQHKDGAYSLKITTAKVNNATFHLKDRALKRVQKDTIDRVYVTLKDINSAKRSWLSYKVSMRLNKRGILKGSGKFRRSPLTQSGRLQLKNLALQPLTPYLQTRSYLSVDDGRVGFSIKERYRPSKTKPDLQATGSMTIASLFLSDTHKKEKRSLFTLNKLSVKPFTLELFPNRLYINEVDADAFYVDAEIDANKTINFAKLMKPIAHKKPKKQEKSKHSSKPFPVKIAKVAVQDGSAEFKDLSLPIKFQTHIHNLNGIIYSLSSVPGDSTYAEMDGEIDKYGSMKLKANLDSFNPKKATKLNLDFQNLDLHAMSGYSASFAGYTIDSGKLYLKLGYNILNSKLDATNNIVIKKIKLGKELEGKDVKHLPLGFVIGLLEDSDGVIDIDMPIDGDVDAPDFKYGTIVWNALGNLIAKAVTSPFKFLGSMMGIKSEDIQYIDFEFGKSTIAPPQREKLDKIGEMMLKHPKINLRLAGMYNKKGDLYALQLQKLIAAVMKKSGDENTKKAKNSMNVAMLEDIYESLRDDDYLDKLQKKLKKRYKGAAYEQAYQNSLIKICAKLQTVSEQELKELGAHRALAIKEYLLGVKGLKANRIEIQESKTATLSNTNRVKVKLDIDIKSKDK